LARAFHQQHLLLHTKLIVFNLHRVQSLLDLLWLLESTTRSTCATGPHHLCP
jgi:hypothetical protein